MILMRQQKISYLGVSFVLFVTFLSILIKKFRNNIVSEQIKLTHIININHLIIRRTNTLIVGAGAIRHIAFLILRCLQ